MLNSEQTRWYKDEYEKVMNQGLVGKMWRRIHHQLDKPFLHLTNLEIVEVGAGHGQHFNLSKLNVERYVEVDLQQLNRVNGKEIGIVERRVEDAERLKSVNDDEFDLLIATCLLPHLQDPELALNNFRRVVRNAGALSLYVPCEPGIVLRLARTLSTKRKRKKLGFFDHTLHWREHRNHYLYIDAIIKDVFRRDIVIKVNHPFPLLGWDLNLYSLYQIRVDKRA